MDNFQKLFKIFDESRSLNLVRKHRKILRKFMNFFRILFSFCLIKVTITLLIAWQIIEGL